MAAVFFLLFLSWGGPAPKLQVESIKPDYRVFESISFRVWHQHDSYLYVFNMDEKSGEIFLIYPLDGESIRHLGGFTYKIPSKGSGAEFYAGQPGMEHFLFLTTPEPVWFGTSHWDGKPLPLTVSHIKRALKDLPNYGRQPQAAELDIFIHQE